MAVEMPGTRVSIDRGGTFTDVVASIPAAVWHEPSPDLLGNAVVIRPTPDEAAQGDAVVQVQLKLLSVDPQNYPDAPAEGIRRIMQIVRGEKIDPAAQIDTTGVESVRMGTTVATNALLERKGERFGLVMTKGFADLLEMGDHTRPDLFDIKIAGQPSLLYKHEDIIEAHERVTIEGYSLNPESVSTEDLIRKSREQGDDSVVVGISGEAVRILEALDELRIKADLQKLYEKGVRSVAICLLHSYTFPAHEQAIERIARDIGFSQISLSSALSATPKAVPRGHAAAMDAYISPVLSEYIRSFSSRFQGGRPAARCDFMKSDGGLVAHTKATGLRALLSGPAGGVVGCALTAYSAKRKRPIIGYDAGGTSTDVCLYNGKLDKVYETLTAGQRVAVPQLSITTVAAGGGSRLFYKNDLFVVGPESVGAHPGPACYRKGGDLAVTDANAVLGRLIPSEFPRIFGPQANESLDVDASRRKFQALTDVINADLPAGKQYSVDEVAAGFVRIANEEMSRPMRTITQQKGFAPSSHDLCCFGGAGGQHACAIAKGLGISLVVIPRFSSVLSAYGIACADITAEQTEPLIGAFGHTNLAILIAKKLVKLRTRIVAQLAEQDVPPEDVAFEVHLGCHYDGSDTIMHVPLSGDIAGDFIRMHLQETSFNMERPVLLANVNVLGRGASRGSQMRNADYAEALEAARKDPVACSPSSQNMAYFDSAQGGARVQTGIYRIPELPRGASIPGPAILVDSTQTLVVEPGCTARILPQHVIFDVGQEETSGKMLGKDLTMDPITLAVFAARFMSIAEQMGVLFEKTSVSLSIKERLDFSCSIHKNDGGLVANAPHIPIHLGSMADAVKYQHKAWLGQLKPGDVLLTNHPDTGGTHLPDLTVVTPIFDPSDSQKILFYVASRGHHTDIGGNGVTSMNPRAKELWEEGFSVKTFKLVSEGVFHEEGVRQLFAAAGDYPGCSATRRIDHNITDLQAAISANVRGSQLMNALFEEFGAEMVMFYMGQIQALAAKTIQAFLRDTFDRFGGQPLQAEDYFDDGTLLKLKITIDKDAGTAVFDWSGTGPQTLGNFNVPIAISYASIIYCLRLMIKPDIPMPLNQGVLDPITNIVPSGCILNPTGGVAVSGSTIASQRLVDVILKAFRAAAASQGCANSLGFGTGGKDMHGNVQPGFAYGEAFGGGAGAGPGWHGAHAVSVHSTNTKLTDVEVIESRTPLLLKEFGIRRNTGGVGEWRGGDGCYRHFIVREPLNCSIVSQRRVFAPYGMQGGGAGARGRNTIYKKAGESFCEIGLGYNGMTALAAGDEVRIESPGGGGWGYSA